MIRIENLTKRYKTTEALKGVNLHGIADKLRILNNAEGFLEE